MEVVTIRLNKKQLTMLNNALYREYERLENCLSLHEKNRARELAEVYQEETNKAYDLHIKLEELLKGAN